MTTDLPLDATDPLIVILTWALTLGIRTVVKDNGKWDKVRTVLPGIAILIAVGLRAAIETMEGQVLTTDSFLRAVAAGAVAVMMHSQARGIQKGLQEK